MRCSRSRAKFVLMSLLTLSLGVPRAHAQILVNGNFESGPAIPPLAAILALGAGSTALPGWTVSSGTIVLISDVYWVPLSGTRRVASSRHSPRLRVRPIG
jgi:hypothetical protein